MNYGRVTYIIGFRFTISMTWRAFISTTCKVHIRYQVYPIIVRLYLCKRNGERNLDVFRRNLVVPCRVQRGRMFLS